MMDARQYTAASDLPECLADLWVVEVRFDETGEAVFHVEDLVTVLQTNDTHTANGWHSGFAPFALCRTVEEAHAVCDRMRRKQKVLREMQQDDERVDVQVDVQRQQPYRARVLRAMGDFMRRRGGQRQSIRRSKTRQ